MWTKLSPSIVLLLLAGHMATADSKNSDNQNDIAGGLRRQTTDQTGSNRNKRQRVLLANGDIDVRFNKFANLDGTVADFMPLTHEDYPMTGFIANYLKNQTNAASVVCVGDYAVKPEHIANAESYIEAIGGYPSMPNINPQSTFWEEMTEITMMQLGRQLNMNPGTILRSPDLWSDKDIHAVAAAVHDEFPGELQVELITWLVSQNVPLDTNIIPFRSKSDFVGRTVAMATMNTWAIGAVSPFNFYLKWYAGRPRPEEVAYKIYTRELTVQEDGVPPDLVLLIDQMNLTTPMQFTAYPEGSPRHPSWPAMHSAASSASFWLAVMFNLTPEQYCEALRLDYAVAFARTCAGVHYRTDNIAGLNLGQVLMAELLPDHLAQMYGSDPDKVRAKIAGLRFDWKDFDSFSCNITSSALEDTVVARSGDETR
jgi:membrane-associated phospholipid phosphatase